MATPGTAELGLALQSARGSPAAAAVRRVYLTGGTLPAALKPLQADRSVSTTRVALGPVHDRIAAQGSPAFVVRPASIGMILYAALGAKAVSGASDPWTHTLTLGTSLPYLTLWRWSAGVLSERLADVRVARLTLSGASGRPLQATVDLVGGSAASRSAQETGGSVETTDAFLFRHGTGALKIEGAAVSSISDFTLTVATGVTVIQTLAGPLAMLDGPATITLQAEQELVDAALWNRLVYGSATPTNLTAATLTPLELAGSPAGIEFTFTEQASPERSLKLALPRVAVSPPDGFVPDPSYRQPRLTVVYTAFKPASGSPITATLKNAVSSY